MILIGSGITCHLLSQSFDGLRIISCINSFHFFLALRGVDAAMWRTLVLSHKTESLILGLPLFPFLTLHPCYLSVLFLLSSTAFRINRLLQNTFRIAPARYERRCTYCFNFSLPNSICSTTVTHDPSTWKRLIQNALEPRRHFNAKNA